jgi:hypothetical protein
MHNVNYFSYNFNINDCFESWKAAKLSVDGPIKQRLTNALWRRSAQMANDIPKLNPATLGWAKDMDDLTLFGPYSTTDEFTEPKTFKCKGIIKSALKTPEQLQLKKVQTWKQEYSDSVSNSDCSVASKISRVSFNSVVEQRVIVSDNDEMCDCYDSKSLSISSIVKFRPAHLNDVSSDNDKCCECYGDSDEDELTNGNGWLSFFNLLKDIMVSN